MTVDTPTSHAHTTAASPPASTSNVWIAASEGSIPHVAHFLSADPTLTPTSADSNTYTPLHAAASYSHIELLRFLLTHHTSKEGDVNVQDQDGDTPLFLVEDIETAKLLVEEFGADVNHRNKEGLSVSQALEENGWSDVATYIRSLTGEEEPDYDVDEEEVDEDEGDDDDDKEDEDDGKHNGAVTKKYVELLSEFGTCELSDALIKLSQPTGGHIPNLSLMAPRLTTVSDLTSHKVCGQVFPVQMVATSDSSAPPKPSEHFVDVAPEGSVMLVQAPSKTESAIWGGLMTVRAQQKGVKGVVLNGKCRDLGEQWTSGFPIFAKGHSTLGQSPFTRPAKVGEALTFPPPSSSDDDDNATTVSTADPPFPRMTVHPTDLILADIDGVVIIPRSLVKQTVELAAKGREVDELCLKDLKLGKGVQETFKKYRG